MTIDSTDINDPLFLHEVRQQMLRFATQQLDNVAEAEDAVQEALIGALKSVGAFRGKAALKTWIFAILKNKIADSFRRKTRLAEVSRLLDDNEDSAIEDTLFDAKGVWLPQANPAEWRNPESCMMDKDFWRIFEACLDHLPQQQSRVFMMREFINLSSQEICDTAGITLTHLNVLLYRARLRLRTCLENRWFVGDSLC
jgi:RNA polymerase sigma-70 factor (ECF subfamily)